MRKVFLIALFLVSWYLAGFFHAAHIMVLTLTEAMLFFSMYPLSWHLRNHMQMRMAPRQNIRTSADGQAVCCIELENTGRMPVTRLLLSWQQQYRRQAGKPSKGQRGKQFFSLSAQEELAVRLPVQGNLCGLLDVTIKKAYLWDYLGLFRRRFCPKTSIEVAVLPPRRRLRIQFCVGSGQEPETERELFQIREYQQGDRARDIAWKQSVRTGGLFAKEYREIGQSHSVLFLDFQQREQCSPEKISTFYEVLYAAAAGLLMEESFLQVCWRQADGTLCGMSLTDEKEIDLLLCRLYDEEARLGPLAEEDYAAGAKGFCLDLDLTFYHEGKAAANFSAGKMDHQLAQAVYIGEGFDEK